MSRPGWTTSVCGGAAVLLFVVYVGAYFAMVEPTFDPFASGPFPAPYYNLGPAAEWFSTDANNRIDRWGGSIFAPVHWCERRLRREFWELSGMFQ